MKILILGGGTIAKTLIKNLYYEKITIIEKDKEKAEELSISGNCLVIADDANDPNVLDEAGIKEAEVVIAATDSDETNFLSAVYAKFSNVPKVISVVSKIEYRRILERLNIKTTVPDISTAEDISMLVKMPILYNVIREDEFKYSLIEFKCSKNFEGKKISEIEDIKRKKIKIIALYRNGEFQWPLNEKEKLIENDILLLLINTSIYNELIKLLKL